MASSSRPIERLRKADAVESCIPDESEQYDVFLSHRGPDTKAGIVGFLDRDLKHARLKPFLDINDIGKGKDSWESIERAIKRTAVAVVVFSEDFAGSKWCMRELHVMLESPSVTVLPIFYKVKPSQLRHLDEGPFGAGFRTLREIYKCGEEELKSWREDLRKASTINGWEIEENGRSLQVDMLTEIVEKVCEISNEVLRRGVSSEHDKVGVKQAAEQIIATVDEKRSIMMVGLWGMGGIGKSTLARELFHHMRGRYASSCYVKDVTEKVSMPDGVEAVQKHILDGLCKGGENGQIRNKEEGRRLLEGRLRKGSPFLLLLDDISAEKDMMKYLMTPEMLKGGSMCIVTTRDEGVLKEFQDGNDERVYTHAMRKLSSEDSRLVFTSYAFGGDGTGEPKFEALVEGISKACGGVPLVLEVIGSCLKGNNDVKAWEEMKEGLEESGNVLMDYGPIYNRLKRSYDTLSPFQQEMFLDVACGLIGESVDRARRVWKSLKWCPAVNIPFLVRRALIWVDDGGRLVMHDVLRDMGRSIEMAKKAGKRARMWMPESLYKWKEEALPKHLESLVIDLPYGDDSQILDVSDMKGMRILLCFGFVHVPLIPANLRWFSLDSSLEDIPLYRALEKSKLVVPDGSGLRAWPCSALGLGGLTALECLHLRNCRMDKLPNLQQLTKLGELYIAGLGIKAVPGLGHMFALVKLYARWCKELVELPNLQQLSKLEELDISGSSIKAVPGLGHLSALVKFYAIDCSELVGLPNLQHLTKLEELGISGSSIKAVSGLGQLSALVKFDASWCEELVELPDLQHLTKLEELGISGSSIKALSGLGDLSALVKFKAFGCKELVELPDLQQLTKFEELDIWRSSIKAVPGLDHLSALVKFDASDCSELVELPDLQHLMKLEELDISGSSIKAVPGLGHLSALVKFDASDCSELVELPDLQHLTKLEELDISGSSIKAVPGLGHLSALVKFMASDCSELVELPDLQHLMKLEELDISGSSIKAVPGLGHLSALVKFNASDCSELVELPDLQHLTKLEELDISGSSIKAVPGLGHLSALVKFMAYGCKELVELPDLQHLTKLEELDISGSSIKAVPGLGHLSALVEFDASDCSELVELPDLQHLTKLEELDISRSSIKAVPGLGHFVRAFW